MNADGRASPSLGDRERRLIAAYPWIAWTEPQKVVSAQTTRLACRFCTAIDGLKGQDILSGQAGFSSEREFSEHLEAEHYR